MNELRNAEADLSRFRTRILAASLAVVFAFSLVAARLAYLQIYRHEDLSGQAENNRTAIVPIVPNRGLIEDRNGVVLASNYSAYTLEIMPSKVENLEDTIARLGEIVEIQPRDKRRFKRLREESKNFESVPIRTRLSDDEVARFAAQRYRFHGYLLHQFWAEHTNKRDDEYGGSRENRARLMLAVIDACVDAWDADHVGIRISPLGTFNNVEAGYHEDENIWLIEQINKRGLMYLHLSEPDWAGGTPYSDAFRQRVRDAFGQMIIAAGGYTAEKAEKNIKAGYIDAVAFGRDYIANPDLAERIRAGAPLNEQHPQTFYGGGTEGYTDYQFLNQA